MKLYIGNLSWGTTTEDLKSHFEAFGAVSDAIVITDRQSGRSRGFGFVTMDDDSEANKAMEECSGVELDVAFAYHSPTIATELVRRQPHQMSPHHQGQKCQQHTI